MPELSDTITGGGTDYPYRATISHEAFAEGLAKIGRDIHYGNFKNEVARTQGFEREILYHDVWEVMEALHSDE